MTSPRPIILALAEDQPALLRSLQNAIAQYPAFEVLFSAMDGRTFCETLAAYPIERQPQLALLDIEMPEMDGIAVVKRCQQIAPNMMCIMLTVFDDNERIFNAIQAGAKGYLLKGEPTAQLMQAIQEVLTDGGAPMSPSIARKVLALLASTPKQTVAPEMQTLTAREREILALLVEGYDYREAAEKLFVSPNTVRTHIGHIYEKLHVTSRAEAVRKALGK